MPGPPRTCSSSVGWNTGCLLATSDNEIGKIGPVPKGCGENPGVPSDGLWSLGWKSRGPQRRPLVAGVEIPGSPATAFGRWGGNPGVPSDGVWSLGWKSRGPQRRRLVAGVEIPGSPATAFGRWGGNPGVPSDGLWSLGWKSGHTSFSPLTVDPPQPAGSASPPPHGQRPVRGDPGSDRIFAHNAACLKVNNRLYSGSPIGVEQNLER